MPEANPPRNVVVTGTSTGIGRATVRLLASEGFRVFAVVRREEDARSLREEGHENLTPLRFDVTDADAPDRIVACAVDTFGRIDVLINNAALGLLAPLDSISDDDLDACLALNIRAVVRLCRAAWPRLREAGGGVIVNLSSYAAIDPFPGLDVYGGTKAFINTFTRGLGREGQPHGIRAYAVAPGAVETAMLRTAFPDYPADQCLDPDDVAAQIELLLDERNRFSTGGTVYVKKS